MRSLGEREKGKRKMHLRGTTSPKRKHNAVVATPVSSLRLGARGTPYPMTGGSTVRSALKSTTRKRGNYDVSTGTAVQKFGFLENKESILREVKIDQKVAIGSHLFHSGDLLLMNNQGKGMYYFVDAMHCPNPVCTFIDLDSVNIVDLDNQDDGDSIDYQFTDFTVFMNENERVVVSVCGTSTIYILLVTINGNNNSFSNLNIYKKRIESDELVTSVAYDSDIPGIILGTNINNTYQLVIGNDNIDADAGISHFMKLDTNANTLLGILSSGAKLLGLWGNKTKYGSDESIRRSLIIPIPNGSTQLLLTVGNITSLWTQWGSPGDERLRWSHKLCDYLYDYHGDDQVNNGHTVENVDVLDGFIYEGAQDYVRLLILVGIGYTGADGEPTPTSDLFVYSISYNILVSQSSPEILGCGRVGAISNILHGKLSPRMHRNVRDYRCTSTYITFTRESQLYSCHVALDDILYKRYVAVHKLLSYAHCKTDRIVSIDVTPLQEADSNDRRNLLVYHEDGSYHSFPLTRVMSASSVEIKDTQDDLNHFLHKIMTEKMNNEVLIDRLRVEITGIRAAGRNPYEEILAVATLLVDQEPAGYSWGKDTINTQAQYELPVNLVNQKKEKHKNLCISLLDLRESGDEWMRDYELNDLINELNIQQYRLTAVYAMARYVEVNFKVDNPTEEFLEIMKFISTAMTNAVKDNGYLNEVLKKKYNNEEDKVEEQLAVRGISTADVFYAHVTGIDDGLLAISASFTEYYTHHGSVEQRIKYSYELLQLFYHMVRGVDEVREELRTTDISYNKCFFCSSKVRKSVLQLLQVFIGMNNITKEFSYEHTTVLRELAVGLFNKQDMRHMCDIMLSSYVLQCSDNMGSGATASNMPLLFRRDYEEMKEVWIKTLLLLNQIPTAFELSQRYHYFYGIAYCAHSIQDKKVTLCTSPGCGNDAKYNDIAVGLKPRFCRECKTEETMGNVTDGYRQLYNYIAQYSDELATYETSTGDRYAFYTYVLHYYYHAIGVEKHAKSLIFGVPPSESLLDLLQLKVADNDDNQVDILQHQRLVFLQQAPDIAAKYYIRNNCYKSAAEYSHVAGIKADDDRSKYILHSMAKLTAKLHDLKCDPAVVPTDSNLACSQISACQKSMMQLALLGVKGLLGTIGAVGTDPRMLLEEFDRHIQYLLSDPTIKDPQSPNRILALEYLQKAVTVVSLWYDTVDADDRDFTREMKTFSVKLWVVALHLDNYIFDAYIQDRLVRFDNVGSPDENRSLFSGYSIFYNLYKRLLGDIKGGIRDHLLPSFSDQCVVKKYGTASVPQQDSVLMGAALTEQIMAAYSAQWTQHGGHPHQTHVRTLLDQAIALVKSEYFASE